MPNLCQGRLVWANVRDPAGKNEKPRPLVIVSTNEQIAGNDRVIAVAASHSASLARPLPASCVELPYHPAGKTATRLKKPTVAICDWVVELPKSSILEIGGIVRPKIMLEIIAKLPKPSDQRSDAEEPTTDE